MAIAHLHVRLRLPRQRQALETGESALDAGAAVARRTAVTPAAASLAVAPVSPVNCCQDGVEPWCARCAVFFNGV